MIMFVERMMIPIAVALRIGVLSIMDVPMCVGVPIVPVRVGVVDATMFIVRMLARAQWTDAACDRDASSQDEDGNKPTHDPHYIGEPPQREDQ